MLEQKREVVNVLQKSAILLLDPWKRDFTGRYSIDCFSSKALAYLSNNEESQNLSFIVIIL